jgi:hypothetical protein
MTYVEAARVFRKPTKLTVMPPRGAKRTNDADDERTAKTPKVSARKETDGRKKAVASSAGVGKNDSDKEKKGQARSGKNEQTDDRSTRSAQGADADLAADDDFEDDLDESEEEEEEADDGGNDDEDSQSGDDEDQPTGLTGQADADNEVMLEALGAVAAARASKKSQEAARTVQTGSSKESGKNHAGTSKPASSKNDSRHAAKERTDEELRDSFGTWGGDKVDAKTGSMPRKKTTEQKGGAASSTVNDAAKSPAKPVAKTPPKGVRRDLVLPGSTGKKKKQPSAITRDSDDDDVAPGGDLDRQVAQCIGNLAYFRVF